MQSVSWVLSIWFLGSGLIWLLLRVMGGDISYATTLGVIGYCVLPQFVLLVLRFTGVYLWPFRVRMSKPRGMQQTTHKHRNTTHHT